MKLYVNNGKVPYIHEAGVDYVFGEMSEESAQVICKNGQGIMSTDFPDYSNCKGGKFMFKAVAEETKAPAARKGKKTITKG